MSEDPREAAETALHVCECCGRLSIWLLDEQGEPFAVGRFPAARVPGAAQYLCKAVEELGLTASAEAEPPTVLRQ